MTTLPVGKGGRQCLGASLWPGGTRGAERRSRPFTTSHLHSVCQCMHTCKGYCGCVIHWYPWQHAERGMDGAPIPLAQLHAELLGHLARAPARLAPVPLATPGPFRTARSRSSAPMPVRRSHPLHPLPRDMEPPPNPGRFSTSSGRSGAWPAGVLGVSVDGEAVLWAEFVVHVDLLAPESVKWCRPSRIR